MAYNRRIAARAAVSPAVACGPCPRLEVRWFRGKHATLGDEETARRNRAFSLKKDSCGVWCVKIDHTCACLRLSQISRQITRYKKTLFFVHSDEQQTCDGESEGKSRLSRPQLSLPQFRRSGGCEM